MHLPGTVMIYKPVVGVINWPPQIVVINVSL